MKNWQFLKLGKLERYQGFFPLFGITVVIKAPTCGTYFRFVAFCYVAEIGWIRTKEWEITHWNKVFNDERAAKARAPDDLDAQWASNSPFELK